MDPITLILSALTAGAIYVGHVVLKKEIGNTYDSLKEALLGNENSNLSQEDFKRLEKEPADVDIQRDLAVALSGSSVKEDEKILEQAVDLSLHLTRPSTEKEEVGELSQSDQFFKRQVDKLEKIVNTIEEEEKKSDSESEGDINISGGFLLRNAIVNNLKGAEKLKTLTGDVTEGNG